MKDELPLQPESQNQNSASNSNNMFGKSTSSSSDEFASSTPMSPIIPLAETEIEPSTSSLASTSDSPATNSSFFSEPSTSELQPSEPLESTANVVDVSNKQPEKPTEPATSVAPVAAVPLTTQPNEQQPVVFGGTPTPPKKSNRKKFIVIGALVGVFALLGGGSVAAYNLWYQNPDKVLGDALVNALKAKTVAYSGKFDININETNPFGSNSKSSFNIKIDGKSSHTVGEAKVTLSMTYESKTYAISGAGIIDKDANLFIKVSDLTKLLRSLPEESEYSYAKLPPSYKALVGKVDAKWIRVSNDDVRQFSDDGAKTQTCVEDVFKKLQDDKQMNKEVLDVYMDNKFVVIDEKLPAKNGSLGYVVSFDEAKAKEFGKAADNTKFVKELQKCDESFKFSPNSTSTNSSNSDEKTRLELWVDRWSHQLTKASFTIEDATSDGSFVFEPKFNQPVTVDAPKDFIALKDLKKDIENAYAEYMASVAKGYDSFRRESVIDTYRSNNRGKEPTEAEIQQLLLEDELTNSDERTL